jgi:SAM-dependent methyltransferase
MRLIHTAYLPTAQHPQLRPAALIEMEEPADYDRLYRYIVESGYYGSEYFEREVGYRHRRLVAHFFWVAEVARHLAPRRALEVGCGRGDVLFLLQRAGIDVTGVDVSTAVIDQAWPPLRDHLVCGDFGAVLSQLAADPSVEPFDLVCGFDIWEHLPPSRLDEYLAAAVAVSSDDALFYFVVPAFGTDPVFGEQFPLEFEENRADFEARRPFHHLLSDADKGGVPALGHLIWAHTQWWQEAFARHGLIRVPEVEAQVHHFVDPLVPHSVRSFYLFRRDGPAAEARATALAADRPYDRRAFSASVTHLLTRLWWGPVGPLRFDGDVRRRAARSWWDRVRLLGQDRLRQWPRRLTGRS